MRPEARPVPEEQAKALAELVARRRQLVAMITAEGNRKRQAREPKVVERVPPTLLGCSKNSPRSSKPRHGRQRKSCLGC
jgi:transposase